MLPFQPGAVFSLRPVFSSCLEKFLLADPSGHFLRLAELAEAPGPPVTGIQLVNLDRHLPSLVPFPVHILFTKKQLGSNFPVACPKDGIIKEFQDLCHFLVIYIGIDIKFPVGRSGIHHGIHFAAVRPQTWRSQNLGIGISVQQRKRRPVHRPAV